MYRNETPELHTGKILLGGRYQNQSINRNASNVLIRKTSIKCNDLCKFW